MARECNDIGFISMNTLEFFWEIEDFFSEVERHPVLCSRGVYYDVTYDFFIPVSPLRKGKEMRIILRATDRPDDIKKVCCTFGVKRSDGTLENAKSVCTTFEGNKSSIMAVLDDLGLSVLKKRRSELAPSGTLTIACSIEADDDQRCVRMVSQASQTSKAGALIKGDVLSLSTNHDCCCSFFGITKPVRQFNLFLSAEQAILQCEASGRGWMKMKTGIIWQKKVDIGWRIPDFFSLVEDKEVDVLCSPRILFDSTYSLILHAPVLRETTEMGIELRTLFSCNRNSRAYLTFGVRKSDGSLESAKTTMHTFERRRKEYRVALNDLGLGSLQKRRSELVPSGTVTIVCSIDITEQHIGGAVKLSSQIVGQRLALMSSQSSQTSELDFPRPAELISQSSNIMATVGLVRDLKGLLLSGENSDVTFRVKGQDFQVHRSILGARTPVFHDVMFRRETTDRTSGVVEIDDCGPRVFQTFLLYVYTGELEDLTAEDAKVVYEMANKYRLLELKEWCLECIKRNLSIESFCDTIALALKHDERELTRLVTDFFAHNVREIIRTIEWQVFMSEDPIQANELLIKGLGDAKKQIQ